MTTIGELTERVELRRVTKTADGGGGYTRTWATYAEVWARVVPLGGREAVEAGRVEGSTNYIITVRNRDDVLDEDVIAWKGRELNIRSVRRVPHIEQFLTIEAVMGVTA